MIREYMAVVLHLGSDDFAFYIIDDNIWNWLTHNEPVDFEKIQKTIIEQYDASSEEELEEFKTYLTMSELLKVNRNNYIPYIKIDGKECYFTSIKDYSQFILDHKICIVDELNLQAG